MAVLHPGSTLSVSEEDGAWRLRDGEDEDRGRIRGTEIDLDGSNWRLQRTGERSELVTGTGVPVLRFDPAGAKATTLTTSSARFRLARQRPRPFLHRWALTRDVHGPAVLTVSRSPLGTRVTTSEEGDVVPGELALLALGALLEVLDIEPAPAPV